ncbi:MAG: ribonuclease R [Betaproteobacteria bacterium]|nr:ribonuclease R [Betaproteobacteria bacterium]
MNQRRTRAFRSSKRSRRQLGLRSQPRVRPKTSPISRGVPRSADPFFERERARYAEPVPSREYILQILNDRGVPVAEDELERLLGITEGERVAFHRRLSAMEREGEIMHNRRNAICVVDKLDLVRGRIQGHPDGYGFLIRDDGGPDLFLEPKEMLKALHGDRVMARQSGVDRRGRPEGKIVEVLEHAHNHLVGRLHVEHGVLFVVAEDKRISQDFMVPPAEAGGAKPGQVVTAEVLAQPSKHGQAVARVIEVLGNYADPGMEIEIALRKHELPHVFPREVERLCRKIPDGVTDQDRRGRVDLCALPLVTIDGETAKDFDDAVYCEMAGADSFRLIVAIADVSHYVRHDDALDRDALKRGNSVYFPRRVIPMLPEQLSNGLCSINPEVERLCVACDMQIDAHGEIESYRFYPAVMRSHARLTYTLVADVLDDPRGAAARRHRKLLPHLDNLHRLYKLLARARERRGAIDFETIETEMIFDDHGKIARIVPVKRNDAHRLIEECMLAANVCASDFLRQNDHPMLYRIHEGPTPEKLAALRDFLKGFGFSLTGGDEPHARDYAKLLARVKDRPDAQLLQTVMLRSLQQAVYSPDNVGHFGLAYESYTHFTSPIRRYPDLLVHRAIKAVLARKRYEPGNWHELGARCSMTERRADDATRDVVAWLKCYYMQDKIGESFEGSISGVTAFGTFVALDDVYVEGLVHVSDLGNDYFHFDAVKHQLMGERTKKRYRLGDRLRLRVARVDLDTSKIDFVLDEKK